MNNSDVDVSQQQDDYEDDDLWNQDENVPPRSQFAKSSNLEPIREESRVSYSQSVTSTVEKGSAEITENTQATSPPLQPARSISFADESFGTVEDKEEVLQREQEHCHERNWLRPQYDVSQDEGKVRSWEPTPHSFNLTSINSSQAPQKNNVSRTKNDLNLSKSRRSPVSSRTLPKHTTSTPIAGRSPNIPQFSTVFSEIRDNSMAQNNAQNGNNSSSFSTTALHRCLKDVKDEQSTMEVAKNFLGNNKDYSQRVEKQSIFLKNVKNKSQIKQQKPHLPVTPRLPTVYERHSESFSSRPSFTQAEIAIKPEPLSHWGFVAVGEEVRSIVHVHNQTSGVIEVEPRLNFREGCPFRLASTSLALINANEIHSFYVIFAPKKRVRYCFQLHFVVRNSNRQYSHNLFGYGGAANVSIIPKTLLKASHYPNQYNYTPQDINRFIFEVENSGDRTAFVHIVPVDENDTVLQNVVVFPDKFALLAQPSSCKATIKVELPEECLQRLNRMSMTSLASGTSTTRSRLLTLKIYFGDERLRQRAKLFSERENCHDSYNGLLFTKNDYYVNGSETDASEDDKRLSIQDVNLLKAQTRVMTLVVSDDRLIASSYAPPSSRPSTSHSNRGLQPGFYIPSNNTNDLSIVSIANTNRTMMKTRRK